MGALSQSSGSQSEHAPDVHRKSAGIVRFPKEKLPAICDDLAREVARLISATFPGTSQSAVARRAHQATGISPDTFERILSGHTTRIDLRVVAAVVAVHQVQTGRAVDLGGIIWRIMQGANT